MPSYHMTPDSFREHGHAVVEWIANYMETVGDHPVLSRVAPGDIMGKMPEAAPEQGEPFASLLRDVDDIVMPGLTHWQSPRFFGFFPANSSGPAILGDLLASGLAVQGMLWQTSPACTEVETRVLDWLVPALGLPGKFLSTESGGGVIQDTASSATLCAMLAARERCAGWKSNDAGVDRRFTVYSSTEAHSSIMKSAMIAGIGRDQVRLIETDENFALRPDHLAEAVRADRAAGLTPAFVCAAVGTTSTHGIDPVPAIADVCAEENLWLHVDAAAAGPAALCPEFRWIHDGVDRADSYCFNPHKWMFTNFDCDCFWVADRAALIRTLNILPEYLRNAPSSSGAVFDYRDWHVPLGRRFRALKLWFVIRHYGLEGLRHHLREHIELTQEMVKRIDAHDRLERVAPAPLNLVCFRHVDGDERTESLHHALNDTGRVFLTHTRAHGHYAIRFSIGGTWTDRAAVEEAWRLIDELA